MASIRKRGPSYVSRIQWRDRNGRSKEKNINLNTHLKSEAFVRNIEVQKVEEFIKDGEEWTFPWQDGGGHLKPLNKTIEDAIEEFYAVKRLDNLRSRTFEAYEQGLNAFKNAVGPEHPIKLVGQSEVNIFKEWSKKRHAPSTTNLCLQKIKSFLNYCYEKELIKEKVNIDMIKVNEKPPMYLSDQKLARLFVSNIVDVHFRRAFAFYVSTGCRLEEPFNGSVSGNWLIINPESSKSGVQREVALSEQSKPILLEMRKRVESSIGASGHGSKGATRKWVIKSYSRMFKKVAKTEGFGEHKFHNLRDTYATRRWAVTGDIYAVSKEIGHTSVKMTQKYTKINLRRLVDDFPSIASKIQERLSYQKIDNGLQKITGDLLKLDG